MKFFSDFFKMKTFEQVTMFANVKQVPCLLAEERKENIAYQKGNARK